MADTVSLTTVVGRFLRRFREERGLRQDDIAGAARALGLSWGRSSVSAIEDGIYAISGEELLLLPHVLMQATMQLGGAVPTLAEILSAAPKEWVGLGQGAIAPGMLPLLIGLTPGQVSRANFRAPLTTGAYEAEQKAARKLRVPVEDIVAAGRRRWGRTLTEERDERARSIRAKDARSLQAARGHITRQLLAELAETIQEA